MTTSQQVTEALIGKLRHLVENNPIVLGRPFNAHAVTQMLIAMTEAAAALEAALVQREAPGEAVAGVSLLDKLQVLYRQIEQHPGDYMHRAAQFALRDVIAALSAQAEPQVAVTQGFKLVPVEPTEAMLDAAVSRPISMSPPSHERAALYSDALLDWRAMLSAAPEPKP